MKHSLQTTSSLYKIIQHNIVSALLYLTLYVILSTRLETYLKPFAGITIIFVALAIDILLSLKNIRIYIRFVIFVIVYLMLRFMVHLLSGMASPADTLNIFDTVPYLFDRDTIMACIIMLFYFTFDALRIRKHTHLFYTLSTVALITAFVFLFKFDETIQKSIFKNWFAYSLLLVWSVILFLVRHITYTQNRSGHSTRLRDLGLFMILLLPLILLLFMIILPHHIDETSGTQSGLYDQNLFEFDFSKLLKLQDEIKLSDDRVLIMELGGTRSSISRRINRGWKRQIYLKRFSLEEYTDDGSFKMAEIIPDPHSPPVFVSDYKWQLDDPPKYRDRSDIIETLYLINIDSSSLMGSHLLTKVAPITIWDGAPYKQIYRSYCTVFDRSYFMLNNEPLKQDEFLKNIDPRRKKQLLHWGTEDETEQMIQQLALDITIYADTDFKKARLIERYLRDNYWYSLKPGIAPDGDQLGHFLFTSEKAYCTYFAFSMVLMLRSLGIASRVAVGFAPDMENRTLNFYDVRALDGHAWVEVYFDEYGWLTFDPTSANIHPDEEFEFAMGNKEERDDLIEEILKNRDNMEEINKEKEPIDEFMENVQYYLKQSIRLIPFILLICLVLGLGLFIILRKQYYLIRYKMALTPREKIIFIYRHILGRLLDMGYPIHDKESLTEYGRRITSEKIIDMNLLTEWYQEALFRTDSVVSTTQYSIEEMAVSLRNQLKQLPRGKRIKAFFNLSRLWRRILPLILFCLLFSSVPARIFSNDLDPDSTDLADQVDIYIWLQDARSAANSGYYDKALNLLDEAEELFPDSYRPNLQKGKLYYSHELYENALIEFHKAKDKGYESEDIYISIASSYGRIGEDRKAVATYEEAYDTLYRTSDLYDNLGWMYFKIHEIDKGIEIVEEGLAKYQNSSDQLMTLGTLYSAKWDYVRSKQCYLDSIKYSYMDYKSNNFRAIAYYDLALLEHAFLYYDYAYQSSKASISMKNRSSAHMQLNYLYLSALDLPNAYREVIRASSLEPSTFFPQQSLIHIFLYAGKPDKALEIARQLLAEKDFSWMLYFGINKEAFYADIYSSLAEIYKLKANQLAFTRESGPWSAIKTPFIAAFHRAQGLLYKLRSVNLIIKISQEKRDGGNELDSLHMLREAYDGLYDAKSLKMLRLAADIELPINPAKKHLYQIDEAILQKKSSPLYSTMEMVEKLTIALQQINPEWERDSQATALLAITERTDGEMRYEYAGKLYAVHPPLTALYGIKMPMQLRIDSSLDKRTQRKLAAAIARRGVEPLPRARFSLEISNVSDDSVTLTLFDGGLELQHK